jgi:CRISPR-associated endoribonuclease Cas6
MRIKLTIQPMEQRCVIPINYQYPLSAAIYKIVNNASPEYAEFLHEKGYISPNGKPLKLFTFSRIWCPAIKRIAATLVIKHRSNCYFQIASPMLEDFVQNFIIGLFQQQEIEIGGPHAVGRFMITQVETLPLPIFESETKFKCLSSIVVSTMHEYQGKLTPYYFRPDDQQLSEAIQNNLRRKFETINNKSAADLSLIFEPDQRYIKNREKQGKRVTKKITIKEGDREATDIICFEVPFTLKGSHDLMEIAYECGIGEKNSMGFGMIEVVG